MKQILFVLLPEFADWEAAPLAAALHETGKWAVKTVAATKAPVRSIGGFSINPDYTFDEAANLSFAGLILIGGKTWRTKASQPVHQLVELAVERGILIGAICDATVFLASTGLLNNVAHTSNLLSEVQAYAKDRYTGATLYRSKQAVSDGSIITANGTATLEFAREVLLALHVMPVTDVEAWYRFYKEGYCALTQSES